MIVNLAADWKLKNARGRTFLGLERKAYLSRFLHAFQGDL